MAFQQAVFRSYDIAKKRKNWLQKIQLLLDKQNYTGAEYIHVASLLNHLHEDYFATVIYATEANERKQFASDWISKAKITLGWSEKQIAFVIYKLYTNPAQFDIEINTIQAKVQEESIDPNGDCTCNTSLSFVANWHAFQEVVIFQPAVAGCGLNPVMEHAAKKHCQSV